MSLQNPRGPENPAAPQNATSVSGTITAETPANAVSVQTVSAPQPAPTRSVAPSRGLGVGVVVLILFAVTVLAALADTLVTGSIGYATGGIFVVTSVVCAALIRFTDLSVAVITPPLAFFTAVALAGQPALFKGATDHLAVREAAMIITGLAASAPWIFAGTGAALLIVVVRRWILRR